jgi:hypothetical protein
VCFTQDLVLLKCFNTTLDTIGVFYPGPGNSNNQLGSESNLNYEILVEVIRKDKELI